MTISLAVPDILVARAQSGDLEALEALYRAFETPVYNLALRVLRRPEDAEDVLQETFLEVVRSIKQYRGEGHLWGWIRQIAASKALMRIRREQVRQTEELYEEAWTRSGLRGMRGRARGAVPARRAAQGPADAPARARPLAGRARRRSCRTAPSSRALGRMECGGGRRRRSAARVPAILDHIGRRRRPRARQGAVGDARAAAAALRPRRPGDERPLRGALRRAGGRDCRHRRRAGSAGPESGPGT